MAGLRAGARTSGSPINMKPPSGIAGTAVHKRAERAKPLSASGKDMPCGPCKMPTAGHGGKQQRRDY